MTEQEIKTRIEKKEKDILKTEKRIKKWTTGMSEEAKNIVMACTLPYDDPNLRPAYNEYIKFGSEHSKDPTVYRQDYEWNKGPNFEEAYRACRELGEQRATLEKYKTQLDKLENFSNMEKIPAIWDFLQEWRKEAYDFFVENVGLYQTLTKNFEAKWEEYKNSEEYKKKAERSGGNFWEYPIRREFEENYFAPIHRVTREIYTYAGKWDDAKLNKILDKDVQNKYNDFVHRITEKAGVIQDASGLHMAGNGIINGTVIGDKNKVKVETILAGGYNTNIIVNVKHGQILHYRILVNVVK